MNRHSENVINCSHARKIPPAAQSRTGPSRRAHEARLGGAAAVARHRSLSPRGYSWFWPKIAAALVSKHHWLIIACDACGTVVDLDLRVKPRDPEASVRAALRGVQCPRCNGHGRPRIIGLSSHPSV